MADYAKDVLVDTDWVEQHLRPLVGLSVTTCWRLRRAGRFPAPIRLSPGRIGWRLSILEAWLASRATA